MCFPYPELGDYSLAMASTSGAGGGGGDDKGGGGKPKPVIKRDWRKGKRNKVYHLEDPFGGGN